jgi:hypothetical protein
MGRMGTCNSELPKTPLCQQAVTTNCKTVPHGHFTGYFTVDTEWGLHKGRSSALNVHTRRVRYHTLLHTMENT